MCSCGTTSVAHSLSPSPWPLTHSAVKAVQPVLGRNTGFACPASLSKWAISQGGGAGKPVLLLETGETVDEEEERSAYLLVSGGSS